MELDSSSRAADQADDATITAKREAVTVRTGEDVVAASPVAESPVQESQPDDAKVSADQPADTLTFHDDVTERVPDLAHANIAASLQTVPDGATPQPLQDVVTPRPQDVPVTPTPLPPDANTVYPGGPYYPPQGPAYYYANPQPPVVAGPRQPGRLARPLPWWGLLTGIALIIVSLVVLQLTGWDWAAGAVRASDGALVIGLVLLLALVARSIDGMASKANPKRWLQYALSLLCIVVLLVGSGVGQAIEPMLHMAQAHTLEDQQQWQSAINEYTLGGARAPLSEDLARTYTSWGLALVKAHQYETALTKFNNVLTNFNQDAVDDQFHRAQQGNISAWYDLGQQEAQQKDFSDATAQFDTILKQNYCDQSCQQKTSAVDATAYYGLGKTSLQAGAFANAVNAFEIVQKTFPNAPEAKQLHGDMAKALLGEGQETIASNCDSAVIIYQRLVKEYGDTAQGKQAGHDLNAPLTIEGTFVNTESSVVFTDIALVQGLDQIASQDELFNYWDNAVQKTAIQSNGSFKFTGVQPGTYDLLWMGADSSGNSIVEYMYLSKPIYPAYTARVSPLCSADVGKVSNDRQNTNV